MQKSIILQFHIYGWPQASEMAGSTEFSLSTCDYSELSTLTG
jgi:hypothetical protein